ncbi:unnamed protein product, partial [Prunus brigantina]
MMRSVGLVPKLVLGRGLVIAFGRLDIVLPFGTGTGREAQLRRSRKVALEKTKGHVESMGGMSDSESGSEREPNAYKGESSDGMFDTDSGGVAPDAEDGSDTDIEIIGECSSSAPSHGIGKGFMTAPVPLTIVYADGRQVGPGVPGMTSAGQQPKASTSGRGESVAEPSSRPRVSVVFPSNPKVPMGVPKEHLIGVDYLEPNKITELEIAKYRREYFIPDSIKMRIP